MSDGQTRRMMHRAPIAVKYLKLWLVVSAVGCHDLAFPVAELQLSNQPGSDASSQSEELRDASNQPSFQLDGSSSSADAGGLLDASTVPFSDVGESGVTGPFAGVLIDASGDADSGSNVDADAANSDSGSSDGSHATITADAALPLDARAQDGVPVDAAGCYEQEARCDVDLWPGGVIRYAFAGDWSDSKKAAANAAFRAWEAAAAGVIQFVDTSDSEADVRLALDGCSSERGKVSSEQVVNLDCSSVDLLTVVGSLIGLAPQHTRSDRDRYLEVLQPLCGRDQLEHCTEGDPTDYGPYRTDSIMQLGSEDFEPGCAARGDCSVRTRAGELIERPQLIGPYDGSTVAELYAGQTEWRRFRPIPRLEPEPDSPVDTRLTASVGVNGDLALATTDRGLEAFARGNDGLLYNRVTDDGVWRPSEWSLISQDVLGRPALVWMSGKLYLLSRTTGVDLQFCARSGTDPLRFECEILEPPPGAGRTSDPAVTTANAGHLDAFVIRNGVLYRASWAGGVWSEWEPLKDGAGGLGFEGAPSAGSWGPNRIDFVANHLERGLYTSTIYNNGWVRFWWALDGTLRAGTSAITVSPGLERVDIFAVERSQMLMWKGYRSQLGWAPWKMLGGLLEATPAAAEFAGRVHVMAQIDGGVWAGSWNKP